MNKRLPSKTNPYGRSLFQSHELRRPVASIIGLMDLLKSDERVSGIEELELMGKAVAELDEKIHLVVGYTTNDQSNAESAQQTGL